MFVVDADLNRCGEYYYYIIVIVISLHSDEKLTIVNKNIHTYILSTIFKYISSTCFDAEYRRSIEINYNKKSK